MTHPITKRDSQIQRDVLAELTWDTRVKETDVGVEVKDGIVTFTGTIDSWAARMAAQEAAHRVPGVLDVADDLTVKLQGWHERSDSDVAQAARGALEWDVGVPHAHIRTTVAGGVVTLEGKVDYWSQHDDAARAVRNLIGVREVKNLLTVEPSPPEVSPGEVESAIESALERHAEHAAKHVHVSVAGHRVLLTGRVPSWAEYNTVAGAVRGTLGVRTIDNRLRIQA